MRPTEYTWFNRNQSKALRRSQIESIRVSQAKGKDEHLALTELLGLKDFQVIGYEIYEPEHQLILLCEVVHQVALCPDCQQPSKAIHEYKPQLVRDVSAFGLEC